MNKTYKKIGLVLLALMLCVCVLFAGCKDAKEVVTGISIKSGEEPRLTYVQGQSLDLTSGKLTVVKEDVTGNESISLSAPEVTVSGYDANKLGEQTITVAYGEFTTQFDVTVIPRMVVSGYKTEYMIGESFSTKGSVIVANDDGTTKSVSLNDSTIKVEGFDSSEVMSPLTLTATYTAGLKTYSVTFDVSIKAAEEVKIKLPTNVINYSHQEGLDLTGGEIIVTFGGKQTPIKIDQSMVFGFNPSAATIENMEKPLKQTVTITYAGVSKPFEIEIYYTAVSLMKKLAAEAPELQFNADKGSITPDEVFGPQAIHAMTEYYKLKASDRVLVTKAEREKVVRHAVAYGRVELAKHTKNLSNVFVISGGVFYWKTNGTHAEAQKAYEIISDDTSEFVTLGALLYRMKEDFKDTEVVAGATVGNNVPEAFSPEALASATEALGYILELHDQLAEVIPIDYADWTSDDLNKTEVSAAIVSIVGKLMNGKFSDYSFVPIYQMLSTWRANDDYFDIVYAYYYYGGEERQQMIGQMFQRVPLPKLLQDIYAGIANGYTVIATITSNPNETVWYPTEDIFRAYRQVMMAKKALQESGSDFCKELYEFINMDAFIDYNLIFGNDNLSNTYYDQVQEMFGDPNFEDLWDSYLELFTFVNSDGLVDLKDPETAAHAASVLKKLVDMPPSWQYSFIASMHSRYREIDRYSKGGVLVLDFTDDEPKNYFVYAFATYFLEHLSYVDGTDEAGNPVRKTYETAVNMAKMLFRAIEQYALQNRYNNAIRAFGSEMEELERLYATLEGVEKEKFDAILGYAYEEYIKRWKQSISTETTVWGEYESTVQEMQDALKVFFEMEAIINNPTLTADQKADSYPLLFAAYEKAAACGEILNAIADENLRYAYFNTKFEINDQLTCPLEHGLWKSRDTFIDLMLRGTLTVTEEDGTETVYRAWERYKDSGVQAFMVKAFYVMATQHSGGAFDAAKVLEAMAAYRDNMNVVGMFYSLRCDVLYFEGINAFMSTLADDIKALGLKLVEVEKAVRTCTITSGEDNEQALAALKTAMEEAIALQAAVTNTEAYNANLKDMYEYYLEVYRQLFEAEA